MAAHSDAVRDSCSPRFFSPDASSALSGAVRASSPPTASAAEIMASERLRCARITILSSMSVTFMMKRTSYLK